MVVGMSGSTDWTAQRHGTAFAPEGSSKLSSVSVIHRAGKAQKSDI